MEKLLFEIINENTENDNQSTAEIKEQSVQPTESNTNEVVETKVSGESNTTSTANNQTLFSKYKILVGEEEVQKASEKAAQTVEVVTNEVKSNKEVIVETFKPKIKIMTEVFKPAKKVNVELFQPKSNVEVVTFKPQIKSHNCFERKIVKNLNTIRLNRFNNLINDNLSALKLKATNLQEDPVLDAILEQLDTVKNLKNKLLNSTEITYSKLDEIEKILDRNISLLEDKNV